MSLPEPNQLSATEALALLRRDALSCEDLARACLARIAERDALVRAWAHVDPHAVLAQARELDKHAASGAKGPLHGLPVGIKDVILTRDMPTRHNSPIHQHDKPMMDAACVSLLRSAGALILGKTDTVEYAATGRRALTRNPHNLAHTPGASSSGSAAAVADGHVPLALGTQTGGSMIRPAAYCGVPAIKPTWGLLSREGAKTFSDTLDTIGWFGRSVDDLVLLYQVFDPEPGEVTPLDLSGARIALWRTPAWSKADTDTQACLDDAVSRLREAGATVSELSLPPAFDALPALQWQIMHAEGRSAFLAPARSHPGLLHPSLQDQVDNRQGITRQALCAAYDAAAHCRAQFDALVGEFDAVLAPSATGQAPRGLAFTGDLCFNGLWTLLHGPCVHVPGWHGQQGLPVGVTLAGPRFHDRQVLGAALALQGLLQRPA